MSNAGEARGMNCCSRLGFINALAIATYGAAGLDATPVAAQPAADPRNRVVLLGTAGGPALRPGRSSSGAAVVVDGVPYVIDCGYGVGRQLVNADILPSALRTILLTHQHSDHNADLGNLLVLAWETGLQSRVDVYGPPRTAKLIELALQYHAYDIAIRIPDEGRVDPAPLFVPHESSSEGVVLKDDRVTIESALVNHPPVVPAFAYKVRTPSRTIVFSGDTAYSPRLIAFARDADVLVHEVLLTSALDRLLASNRNAANLRSHIVAAHTDAEDVGRVATAAGVKKLVLTHFVPQYDPMLKDDDWAAPVRKHYAGEIVVGHDLLAI